jgi:tRNA dimethylallyltransferase
MTNGKLNSRSFSKLIFLFGPTGVGKTALLTELCKDCFSVINADSIQVYKGLDIGSAKVSPEVIERVPHYLVDILQPWQQFTVAKFIELADLAVEDIVAKGRIPIVSGGTAYYFKHFLYGLSNAPQSTAGTRQQVAAWIEKNGIAEARKKLLEVDPVSYGKIAANDVYRLSRALEVYEDSGKPLSSFEVPTTFRYGMEPLVIGLYRSKEEMDQRMRLRFSMMMEAGLLEEIGRLRREGADPRWPGMQGIGYREFFSAMESGEYSISQIGDEIVRDSRLYAKRQLTFFRSFCDTEWVHADDMGRVLSLVKTYLST